MRRYSFYANRKGSKKKEERKRLANLKVWQKTTSSSRLASTTRIQPADIYDGDDDIPPVAQPGIGGVTTETHHREKEDMSSFIAKKREMFLVPIVFRYEARRNSQARRKGGVEGGSTS